MFASVDEYGFFIEDIINPIGYNSNLIKDTSPKEGMIRPRIMDNVWIDSLITEDLERGQ